MEEVERRIPGIDAAFGDEHDAYQCMDHAHHAYVFAVPTVDAGYGVVRRETDSINPGKPTNFQHVC